MDAVAQIVVESFLRGNVVQQLRLRGIQIRIQPVLKGANLLDLQVVQIALCSGKEDDDLLLRRQRMELRLLQQFAQPLAAIELVLRDLVQIAAKLGEGGQFAVLRQIELQGGADLLDGLDGRGESHARNRQADVDGGPLAGVEEVSFEKDLSVGDRNNVGRNVGRYVARLRLDDGQRGQRSAAVRVAQLRRTLQQA